MKGIRSDVKFNAPRDKTSNCKYFMSLGTRDSDVTKEHNEGTVRECHEGTRSVTRRSVTM